MDDFEPVHVVAYSIWKDSGDYNFDNDFWMTDVEDMEELLHHYISCSPELTVPGYLIIYDLPVPDYTACALIEAGKVAIRLDRERRILINNLNKDSFGQF